MKGRHRAGFVLLPVILTLALVATATLGVNRAASLETNLATRGFDAQSARYVAEAGLARLHWELQKSNCTAYPSLSDVPFGVHRFSASPARAAGQPVDLFATSMTASGASARLDRLAVKVMGANTYEFGIEAGEGSGRDAHLDRDYPTVNYGVTTRLRVDALRFRTVLYFDLAALPAGAEVLAATLQLFQQTGVGVTAGTPMDIAVHRLTRAWTEGTGNGNPTNDGATYATSNGLAAWTTPGGDYDPVAAAAQGTSQEGNRKTWDVGALVRSWVDGTVANHGVLLIGGPSVANTLFGGKGNAVKTEWPLLIVRFRAPCSATGVPNVVRALAPSADTEIAGAQPSNNFGNSVTSGLNSGQNRRMLMRFDLVRFLSGTRIQSARLRVFMPSISTRSGRVIPITAHALTADWAEGNSSGGSGIANWTTRAVVGGVNVAWTTAGGDYRAAAAGSITLPASFQANAWVELDVTGLVQEWIDGLTSNLGVILINAETDRPLVNTREASSNQPRLVITY